MDRKTAFVKHINDGYTCKEDSITLGSAILDGEATSDASKALLDQIENIVKLIRSKGVGIYFVTQNPTDVPPGVLSQLGLKIQHALRA